MTLSPLRHLKHLYVLVSMIALVVTLYVARSVLIPIVLAVLLAFLLSPVMLYLERKGFRRLLAAATVLVASLSLFVGVGMVISQQFRLLMHDLPRHREAIVEKIESLRDGMSESMFSGLSTMLSEVRERLSKTQQADQVDKPTPVEIVSSDFTFAHSAVAPMAESLLGVGLVLVLTFFILLRREDIRNRILALVGPQRLFTATKAIDDVSSRIGSFLLTQLLVNTAFGVVFGLGLFALGIPYPLLGGFIAGLSRYVPFVGIWVAGIAPVMLSFALLPGWGYVVLVIVLLAVLEISFAHLLEPIAFGQSIGVSEVALLVALAFWGWVWGVSGMILATPLTACLVVFARNTPELRFIATLLGDEPGLKPAESLYQRLVARDLEEAGRIVSAYKAQHTNDEVYTDLFLPVLRLGHDQVISGNMSAADEGVILNDFRTLLPTPRTDLNRSGAAEVIGFALGEKTNELGLELLARVLPLSVSFQVTPADVLTAEIIQQTEEASRPILVLGLVAQQNLKQTRLLVKRLRKECPAARILVGWWGEQPLRQPLQQKLMQAGADGVANSLVETRAQLSGFMSLTEKQPTGSLRG